MIAQALPASVGFGVRQLAAAFRPASLLAGISAGGTIPRQQAGSSQSGSKLPHSKASLTARTKLGNCVGIIAGFQ